MATTAPSDVSLPASILVPGHWVLKAEFMSSDDGSSGEVSGKGNNIGEAVAQACRECDFDYEIDKAWQSDDWTVVELSHDGVQILPRVYDEHAAAFDTLKTFNAWEDGAAIRAAVQRFQKAERQRAHVAGLCKDIQWLLTIPNGGGNPSLENVGSSLRWVILPYRFHGTKKATRPDFIDLLKQPGNR